MTADSDAALVVGIADYPFLNPLDGSVRDAGRVADWLMTRGGLPEANLELVLSDGRPQGHPILQEIDDAFDRIFEQARSRGTARRLYVYFAGHGCSREIEHVALLMANADLQRLNRAMNASEYRDALAQRLFPEQIYLFDCCRNYDRSVTGRGPEWTFDEATAPMQDSIQVVLYAAGFTEYANERNLIYDHKRGLFTEALIEGLNGAAASGDLSGGDGIVSTSPPDSLPSGQARPTDSGRARQAALLARDPRRARFRRPGNRSHPMATLGDRRHAARYA